jgi:hypothetical protein
MICNFEICRHGNEICNEICNKLRKKYEPLLSLQNN